MFRLFFLRFWFLGPILRSSAHATVDTLRIVYASHDVVPHTRKIFHTSSANHHDRVLLKIMSLSWNVGVHFCAVGKTHTGNLTNGRVRFLWCHGCHLHTHTALERTPVFEDCSFAMKRIQRVLHRGRFALGRLRGSTFSDKLVDCRHK